jgi:molecular chaperone GrpE
VPTEGACPDAITGWGSRVRKSTGGVTARMLYNQKHMDKEQQSIVPTDGGAGEDTQNAEPKEAAAAAAVPEATPSSLPADLAAAYRSLRVEKDALYDRLLRKQAELENLRKRTQQEKADFLQHATSELIRALLPTLDGFERALKQRDATVPAQFYEGMELIYRDLLTVLRRAGLVPLETVGKTFDPHIHQAVETVAAGRHRDQEIVEEFQRGYKLKQRLLRPAIVKVAVAAAVENSAQGPQGAGQRDGKE